MKGTCLVCGSPRITDMDYEAKFDELLAALKLTTTELRKFHNGPHTHPEVQAALLAADTALCPECLNYLRKHDDQCPKHPDYDPTPQE